MARNGMNPCHLHTCEAWVKTLTMGSFCLSFAWHPTASTNGTGNSVLGAISAALWSRKQLCA